MATAGKKKTTTKKKIKKAVTKGRVYIQSTFNNTIVTITDEVGNVIAWATTGTAGFKGTRKSTPFAAGAAAGDAVEKAKAYGLKEADAFIKGVGGGRESALRAIQHSGITILTIKDTTPMPHNGTRRRKPRRV